MFKIAALVWIMIGTVLAGSAVMVVLNVPALAAQGMKLIPIAGIAGYLVAIPVAYIVARRIGSTSIAN